MSTALQITPVSELPDDVTNEPSDVFNLITIFPV
jgi:hypothetical protein